MSQPVIQPSFAAGELSPSLYARVDLEKYHAGARKLRNFFVDYRGGAANRAGTEHIGYALLGKNRLIPFRFSTLQNYALVFSDRAMRVVKDGGLVTEAGIAITGATNAGICTINVVNAWANLDWIFITGVNGMPELNNKFYLVWNRTAATVDLLDLYGRPINSTAFGVYTGGGTAARIYTLTTPFLEADLALLKYTQSADTMTIAHPNYPPQQLTRTGHAAWTITAASFVPTVGVPTGTAAVAGTAGTTTYNYVVTAIGSNGVTESLASVSAGCASAQMSSTPGAHNTVSWAAPAGGALFYKIYRQVEVPASAPAAGQLYGYIGTSVGLSFVDANIAPDFTRTPPQANNPYPSANNYPGAVCYYSQRLCFAATYNAPQQFQLSKTGDFLNFGYSTPLRADDSISATLVSGQVNAIKHLVSMQSMLAFTSDGVFKIDGGSSGAAITPATISALPQVKNGSSDVPPIAVNNNILYVQNKGSTVRDLSFNLYASVYTGDDRSVMANHLFFGHQITEWAFAEEPFKVVWCVRDDGVMLSFTYLKEQEIYAWAHHDTDGLFLSVCSIPENGEDAVYVIVERVIQGQYAKSIERMASRQLDAIPEEGVPADMTKAWFVDSGLRSALTYPASTLTPQATDAPASIYAISVIAGGSGYVAPLLAIRDQDGGTGSGATATATVVAGVITAITVTNPGSGYLRPAIDIGDAAGSGAVLSPSLTRDVYMVSDVGFFGAGNVGNTVRVNRGQGIVRAIADPFTLIVNISTPLTDVWPAAAGTWSLTPQATIFTGLEHLEGRTVQVVADGNVNVPKIVTDGQITLDSPASDVLVGLGYTCDIESLDLDFTGQAPTMQGKRKKVSAVTVRVQDSRGLFAGQTFDMLNEIKERDYQPMGQPIQPLTIDERVVCDPLWNVGGRVCIRQPYPLPATVLGIMPEVEIGDS